MNQDCILALDIGGTNMKSVLVAPGNRPCRETFQRRPLNSKGAAGQILDAIAGLIAAGQEQAVQRRSPIIGIAIAICGPCDYARGISLMQKDKYVALYGMNLGRELRARLDLPAGVKFVFRHDVRSFLLGEARDQLYRWFNRIACIAIGTGIGSAFMIGGKIVMDRPDIPPVGIGLLPHGAGVVEDVIGSRDAVPGLEQIARRALEGRDAAAARLYAEFGGQLGEIAAPILDRFKAECLVLGGQVSRSYGLFADEFRTKLSGVKSLQLITPAQDLDMAALIGAAIAFNDA